MQSTSVLPLLLVLFGFSTVFANVWDRRRKNHRSKVLDSDSVLRLVTASDEDGFKENLLRPLLRVRVPDTEGSRIVQKHIKDHMSRFGWTVEDDTFRDMTPYGRRTFNNIIATQNPGASRKLTLACHHDSKNFTDFEFIGATDSAVPCAMLLDLARALNSTIWSPSTDYMRPDVSLQFIFFDGEEAQVQWTRKDSIYGARHLAELMASQDVEVEREMKLPILETVDVLVLLDLIGVKNPQFWSWFQDTEGLYNKLQNIERRLGELGSLRPPEQFRSLKRLHKNKYFPGQKSNTYGIEDDHVPFLHKRVPVLHLIAYPFPKEWHKEADNERCLDYPTIDNLNKIMRVFVAEYLHLPGSSP